MKYLIIGLLLITNSVCARESSDDDANAIAAQNARYMQGYNERNVEMIVSVHSKTAVVFAPNRPVYKGLTQIRKMIEEDFAVTEKYALELVSNSLEIDGNTAIEEGEYIADLVFKDGSSLKDIGNFIVIWKKQSDGIWLYEKDIFNSRAPLDN